MLLLCYTAPAHHHDRLQRLSTRPSQRKAFVAMGSVMVGTSVNARMLEGAAGTLSPLDSTAWSYSIHIFTCILPPASRIRLLGVMSMSSFVGGQLNEGALIAHRMADGQLNETTAAH